MTKAVAATTPASDDENEDPSAVAAVLPSIIEYSSDSDEDNDLSVCNVSAPVKSKHLIWHCQIHGLTEFPVKTRALIDNGEHVVLIHPKLVHELNLKIRHLKTPEIIDVTLKYGHNSRSELHEYIKLSLTSLDCSWTSKTTVKALIAPNLCMPVILGLPFLIHNTIVTDHAARSCIDKHSNYDLLNPEPIAPPPPPKLKLHEQIKETKADKKIALAELLMVCNDRFKNHKLRPNIMENFNVAGAIRDRIEVLASKDA